MNTATTTVTFRINPELKNRVEALARKTRRTASSFYSQLVEEHISELEEVYECLTIRDGIKAGTINTYTTEEVIKELGL